MLRHYVTIAFRSLRRHAGYAFLNAFGLALGLACAFLAVLFIRDELGQDAFHEKADRIMLVSSANLTTPWPLADAIREYVPGVETVVRTGWNGSLVRLPGETQQREIEGSIKLVDSTFLDVFTFPLAQGDARTALDRIDGLVVTEREARSLFGTTDAMGKTLDVQVSNMWHTLTVTGIAENPPKNTTVGFSALARLELHDAKYREPDSWGASMYNTYALLENGVTRAAFDTSLVAMGKAHDPHFKGETYTRTFFSTPLRDFYLSGLGGYRAGGFTGDVRYLKLFGAIALVVLLIASINYVNLATARGVERAREVGVRKAVGAGRAQVSRQILVESMLLALGAGLLALALRPSHCPPSTRFSTRACRWAWQTRGSWPACWASRWLTGVLAGVYPALVLARYKPTRVLKAGTPAGPGGSWLRRGLVVTQFAATIGLLVYTGLVFKQIDFLSSRYPLPENARLVTLEVPSEWQSRTPTIKNALADLPGTEGVAATTGLPGRVGMYFGVRDSAGTDLTFAAVKGDRDFIRVMNLEETAGDADPPDVPLRMFINEAGMRLMNKPWKPGVTAPLGIINNGISSEGETEIAGVLRDFPFKSLREPIEPLMFTEGVDTLDYGMVVARVDASAAADISVGATRRVGTVLRTPPETCSTSRISWPISTKAKPNSRRS